MKRNAWYFLWGYVDRASYPLIDINPSPQKIDLDKDISQKLKKDSLNESVDDGQKAEYIFKIFCEMPDVTRTLKSMNLRLT